MENENWFIRNHILVTAILSTILITSLWVASYWMLKDLSFDERGTLGDMFGAVNSLFSGLALAGIILTILLQRQELKLQREELAETRKEFIEQNKTLKYQRFENTFFNLLSLHHQIVSAIDLVETKNTTISKRQNFYGGTHEPQTIEHITINGRDVFKKSYNILINKIKHEPETSYLEHYMIIYSAFQTDFGHYFRNLYRIIKFIDETDFFEKDLDNFTIQYKYTSMIRAQLSDYELLWLFYNCLSDNGNEKFKPYIEKYTLLKNLPQKQIHDSSLINLYKQTAYTRTI